MSHVPLSPQTLALAAALPEALGHRVTAGQIVLRFQNGAMCLARGVPAQVISLAVALRDTFGAPMAEEEICLNFVDGGVLQSLERRAKPYGSIETREFFRVRSVEKKRLRHDP